MVFMHAHVKDPALAGKKLAIIWEASEKRMWTMRMCTHTHTHKETMH